jgi:isopenicillin N synthase-like dioxygenase
MDFIPIVDFSKLTNATPSTNDWTITAYEVFHALNGIGFVYLKNHGVDQTTVSHSDDNDFPKLHLK